MGFGVSEETDYTDYTDKKIKEDKERRLKIINGFKSFEENIDRKLTEISKNSNDKASIPSTVEYLNKTLEEIYKIFDELKVIKDATYLQGRYLIAEIHNEVNTIKSVDEFYKISAKILTSMALYLNVLLKDNKIEQDEENKEEMLEIIDNLKFNQADLEKKLKQVDVIKNDYKNKKLHEIFEDDSENFKNLARKYELAFYLALVLLFLYFFGWYIEIDTSFLKFKFAEQFHGNHSATFYVQKISLLILSTTLAAFLLKRSFMNRRLADEAYRTAKELDALPRYMEGMSDEMKEKIRFDLAYKYFGNGIHHDSYTGAENLMHENIKANTEFMKIVKGVPSTTDESKTDKDKNE